jgi:hypothetical protein
MSTEENDSVPTADIDDVEGHRLHRPAVQPRATDDEDDVEGHDTLHRAKL